MTSVDSRGMDVGKSAPPDGRSMVERLFAVVDAFDPASPCLTLTEIASHARLPLSTAHRLIAALVAWGALERDGKLLSLGVRFFELGASVPDLNDLRARAAPHLRDLQTATRQLVHLAVLDGHDVLYVERLAGHSDARVPSRVGGRQPARCTALGKVLLGFSDTALVDEIIVSGLVPLTPYTIVVPRLLRAELHRARVAGVAVDREEARLGTACAAAPVRLRDGRLAAISVAAPSASFDADHAVNAVRAAARGLARSLR